MFPYPFGPVYGGSNYNPATGAESRDLRPLSPNDPRYGQRVPGAMGGMSMPSTNKLPPGYGQEPVIMDGNGSYGPVPETGGITPLPFGESGPVTFSTRPARIKQSPQQNQSPDLNYIPEDPSRPDPIEYTGPTYSTYPAQQFQQGRFPDRLAQKEADRQMQNITWENPNSSIQRIPGTMDFYHKDPITGRITRGTDSLDQTQSNTGPTNMPSRQPGRGRFPDPFGGLSIDAIKANPQAFVDHLVQASEREQQMPGSSFLSQMGGGFGGGRQRNPFMGGGYGGGFGQQMNPFMGGGGFNPFMGGGYGGGFGGQQMNPFMGGGGFNPFMGGGFGGFNPYQQMNPFMGGGFGGYNQQPQAMPYNQQVSQPANPFRNFGGF